MTTSRYLVIARVGDNSLHPEWLEGDRPEFDLFLSYYGKVPDKFRQHARYYEQRPGPKWPVVGDIVAAHRELTRAYDAVWFPDDDIRSDAATINRMFSLFSFHRLLLAQPALDRHSHFSHPGLLQRPRCVLRLVNFVEVMMPVVSREALDLLHPTFGQSASGWGLDSLWPKLLPNPDLARIAILDATPMIHTRPVGGNLYSLNREIDPRRDVSELEARYRHLDIRRRAFVNRFRVYQSLRYTRKRGGLAGLIAGKWHKLSNGFGGLASRA